MSRLSRLFFTFCFLAVLFGMAGITFFAERPTESFYEQRSLAASLRPNLTQLLSGEAVENFEAALGDRIAGRTTLMRLNTALELCLRRPVVNGLVTESDVLLDFHGYVYWEPDLAGQAAEVAGAFAEFQTQIEDYGGYFCYLGLPLQSTYFHEHYPDYMDSRYWHTEAIRAAFTEAMADANVSFLDGHSVYEALGKPEHYYAKTDHHFTYAGAFAAYEALMDRIASDTGLPLTILTAEDLDIQVLPNPYLGSSDRKLYGLWAKGTERLDIGVLKTEIPFTRTDNGQPVDAVLYDLPATEDELVTYNLYMGGDQAETVIETNRPELPTALIFGDSFTNPLETLLWTSFDETRSLDMRHYTEMTLREYIAEYQPDVVICVRDETTYLSFDSNGGVRADNG